MFSIGTSVDEMPGNPWQEPDISPSAAFGETLLRNQKAMKSFEKSR